MKSLHNIQAGTQDMIYFYYPHHFYSAEISHHSKLLSLLPPHVPPVQYLQQKLPSYYDTPETISDLIIIEAIDADPNLVYTV